MSSATTSGSRSKRIIASEPDSIALSSSEQESYAGQQAAASGKMHRATHKEVPHARCPRHPHAAPRPDRKRADSSLPRSPLRLAVQATRIYPLVVRARSVSGVVVEDVDGNRFLDFTAGIAVTSTGHCHPDVVAAIREQCRDADSHVGDRLLLPAADRGLRNGSPASCPATSRRRCSSPTAAPSRSRRPSSSPAFTPAGRGPSPSSAPSMAERSGRCRCRRRS